MTQPAPGVVDAVAHPTQVAGTGVPTLLDMAANPAIEGPAQRTLLDVCMDLFGKLEASLVTNRQEFIGACFATLVKQDEMANQAEMTGCFGSMAAGRADGGAGSLNLER